MNSDKVKEILMMDEKSLTDPEIIRQIGLLSCTVNNVPRVIQEQLINKIDPHYHFCGLYPNELTVYNIVPNEI